jgi:hypothetical protein
MKGTLARVSPSVFRPGSSAKAIPVTLRNFYRILRQIGRQLGFIRLL